MPFLSYLVQPMAYLPPYHIYPCGDHALTIGFGNTIDEMINRRVHQLFYQIKQKNMIGVKDIIPAYSSITVVYDVIEVRHAFPQYTAYNVMRKMIGEVLESDMQTAEVEEGGLIQIPVCYEPVFATDLAEIAALKNMKQLHQRKKKIIYKIK